MELPAQRRPVRSELGRFTVVAGSLAANYTMLYLMYDVAAMTPAPAQALAIVAATPVGFVGKQALLLRATAVGVPRPVGERAPVTT
jgi:putative flippase GtrA